MKYSITVLSQQYAVDRQGKEQYEKYIQRLKKTLDDSEQLQDIEARIVELLAEMQINPGDKVERQHIINVIKQLGGPQSFEDRPIVDTAQHQRTLLMQIMGVILGGTALLVTIFTITAIIGRGSEETFPGTFAEWIYALAGLATILFFVALCAVTAVGLVKTHFTQAKKQAIKVLGRGFVISFVMIFIGALYIAVTN